MKSWSWPCMTTDGENKVTFADQLMADSSSQQIKRTDKLLIRQNYTSVFLLSFIFGLLSIPCSNSFSISTKDAADIIKYFPYNERINIPYLWNKRNGAVNFSPGWGKRNSVNQEDAYANENLNKRAVNFSPGWGKRSGGSVNFSPGWGKRSGGSVNFSPGWGKRAVNFSPSWGKRNVNFSPSWGKRSNGFANFSPSWGKRSGGSVNFSPGWGKRSGGSVNFSPGWGKRSVDKDEELEDTFENDISHEKNLICKACINALQSDDLNAVDDDINSKLATLARDRFDRFPLHNLGLSSHPTQQQLNQAFLNELRLGIHNWKRTAIDKEDAKLKDDDDDEPANDLK